MHSGINCCCNFALRDTANVFSAFSTAQFQNRSWCHIAHNAVAFVQCESIASQMPRSKRGLAITVMVSTNRTVHCIKLNAFIWTHNMLRIMFTTVHHMSKECQDMDVSSIKRKLSATLCASQHTTALEQNVEPKRSLFNEAVFVYRCDGQNTHWSTAEGLRCLKCAHTNLWVGIRSPSGQHHQKWRTKQDDWDNIHRLTKLFTALRSQFLQKLTKQKMAFPQRQQFAQDSQYFNRFPSIKWDLAAKAPNHLHK